MQNYDVNYMCRGGLICPPENRCSCTNNLFIHFVYSNHDLMARGGSVGAERYFREGMLALPYKWFI